MAVPSDHTLKVIQFVSLILLPATSGHKEPGLTDSRSVGWQTCVENDFYDPLMTRAVLDVHMLVALNGAERTDKQWRDLLSKSGFAFHRMVPTRGVFSVVEALPI